jgi:hypothetical protein
VSQSHTEQLQQDLETLRSLVGTEMPFDKTDAKYFVGIGLAALVPAVFGLAGVREPVVLLASSTAFVVAVIAAVIRGYLSTHPSKRCSSSKRREFRPGMWFTLALLPMIGGYCWWAASLDVPAGARNGTVMMFLGVIVAIGAISDPKRYASWCVAIPAIIGGALWPHLEYFQFWTLLWSSFGLGAIAAGVLMLWQLSGQGQRSGQEMGPASEEA